METDSASTLHRLLYKSSVSIKGDEDHVRDQIAAIVAQAAAKNRKHDITGVILHINNTFIQAIEGPRGNIEETFEAICGDLRHDGIKLIEMVSAKERMFGDWSMAHVSVDESPTKLRINRDLQEVYVSIESNPSAALRQIHDLMQEGT